MALQSAFKPITDCGCPPCPEGCSPCDRPCSCDDGAQVGLLGTAPYRAPGSSPPGGLEDTGTPVMLVPSGTLVTGPFGTTVLGGGGSAMPGFGTLPGRPRSVGAQSVGVYREEIGGAALSGGQRTGGARGVLMGAGAPGGAGLISRGDGRRATPSQRLDSSKTTDTPLAPQPGLVPGDGAPHGTDAESQAVQSRIAGNAPSLDTPRAPPGSLKSSGEDRKALDARLGGPASTQQVHQAMDRLRQSGEVTASGEDQRAFQIALGGRVDVRDSGGDIMSGPLTGNPFSKGADAILAGTRSARDRLESSRFDEITGQEASRQQSERIDALMGRTPESGGGASDGGAAAAAVGDLSASLSAAPTDGSGRARPSAPVSGPMGTAKALASPLGASPARAPTRPVRAADESGTASSASRASAASGPALAEPVAATPFDATSPIPDALTPEMTSPSDVFVPAAAPPRRTEPHDQPLRMRGLSGVGSSSPVAPASVIQSSSTDPDAAPAAVVAAPIQAYGDTTPTGVDEDSAVPLDGASLGFADQPIRSPDQMAPRTRQLTLPVPGAAGTRFMQTPAHAQPSVFETERGEDVAAAASASGSRRVTISGEPAPATAMSAPSLRGADRSDAPRTRQLTLPVPGAAGTRFMQAPAHAQPSVFETERGEDVAAAASANGSRPVSISGEPAPATAMSAPSLRAGESTEVPRTARQPSSRLVAGATRPYQPAAGPSGTWSPSAPLMTPTSMAGLSDGSDLTAADPEDAEDEAAAGSAANSMHLANAAPDSTAGPPVLGDPTRPAAQATQTEKGLGGMAKPGSGNPFAAVAAGPARGKAGSDPLSSIVITSVKDGVWTKTPSRDEINDDFASIIGNSADGRMDADTFLTSPGFAARAEALRKVYADVMKRTGFGTQAWKDFRRGEIARLADGIYKAEMSEWKKGGRKPPKPTRKVANGKAEGVFDGLTIHGPTSPAGSGPVGGGIGASGAKGVPGSTVECPCPCRPAKPGENPPADGAGGKLGESDAPTRGNLAGSIDEGTKPPTGGGDGGPPRLTFARNSTLPTYKPPIWEPVEARRRGHWEPQAEKDTYVIAGGVTAEPPLVGPGSGRRVWAAPRGGGFPPPPLGAPRDSTDPALLGIDAADGARANATLELALDEFLAELEKLLGKGANTPLVRAWLKDLLAPLLMRRAALAASVGDLIAELNSQRPKATSLQWDLAQVEVDGMVLRIAALDLDMVAAILRRADAIADESRLEIPHKDVREFLFNIGNEMGYRHAVERHLLDTPVSLVVRAVELARRDASLQTRLPASERSLDPMKYNRWISYLSQSRTVRGSLDGLRSRMRAGDLGWKVTPKEMWQAREIWASVRPSTTDWERELDQDYKTHGLGFIFLKNFTRSFVKMAAFVAGGEAFAALKGIRAALAVGAIAAGDDLVDQMFDTQRTKVDLGEAGVAFASAALGTMVLKGVLRIGTKGLVRVGSGGAEVPVQVPVQGEAGAARAFLGVGKGAPPPSGPVSKALRDQALANARSPWFRAKAETWARLTGKGRIDWNAYMSRLESAEFREFATAKEAWRSGGYSNVAGSGEWIFGVPRALRRTPLVGDSAMQHELFHALQDMQGQLFTKGGSVAGKAGRAVAAEYSAHLWGSPLIGVPFVWTPTGVGLFEVGDWALGGSDAKKPKGSK